jgi:serine/threonine-protein kinase
MGTAVSRHEQTVGRYMLFGAIGSGGMATVHLGRRVGAGGFARLVAVKRLHANLAADREVVHAFLDEARIAARVTHPNVVSIHDVVTHGDEVLLVMEYVPGRSLSALAGAERRAGRAVPPRISGAIAIDMLRGLQAAHDARDERGRKLGLVHRDVSPQNVLVGVDGVSRVLDFGIAKALGRLQTTATGSVKGKLAYMAPERFTEKDATPSVDVYGAAIVVWEMLSGERYFTGPADETLIPRVVSPVYRSLAAPELEAASKVLERALRIDPAERHESASELAAALREALPIGSADEVAAWVEKIAGPELAAAADDVAEIEQRSVPSPAPASKRASSEEPTKPETRSAVVAAPRDEATATSSRTKIVGAVVVVAAVAITIAIGSFRSSRASAPPPRVEPASSTPVVVAVESAAPVASSAAPVASSAAPPPPVRAPMRRAPAPPVSTARPIAPPDPESPADRK